MAYCLLRIAKSPSGKEWGGMVYAEDEIFDGIGPCSSRNDVEVIARAQWPTIETEPVDGLRADGEQLTGYAAIDLEMTPPRGP